ncbi:hypothetical protein NLI96_g272 [Meripilus lineatus]|uniref:Sugar phosphate transporter domain-containing protein n=1 Tax=Meripilus lineatus TaxID=2056292 RepID=A0AAD5VDZ5_9APHY|nr:hypothetical protein NLI96_g272 [Physisporinus lineatus]
MSPSHGHGAPSRALVTATVLFYLVAALAMVMANKWVLNQTSVPLFFLDCQLFIAVFLFLGAHMLGLLQLPLSLDPQVCKGLIPMVGLNVIGLSFSNYTLKYVDASFYQVARGMVLPFTVLTSFIALHARPSLQIILACSIVTFGFFIGVFLDGTHVSMLGIFFGIASSMITAVHSVVIKKSLDVVKGSALHLSWYTNLLSSLALIPIVILTGEVPGIMELLFGGAAGAAKGISPLATFAWGSAITGIFGFLMSIASLLSIKITSPITHMVSSAVRGVAASILGWAIFADIISVGRATSIATILSGSIFYTWVKHLESQGPKYERVNMEKVEEGRKGEA